MFEEPEADEVDKTGAMLAELKQRLEVDVRISERVPRLFGAPREIFDDNFTDL